MIQIFTLKFVLNILISKTSKTSMVMDEKGNFSIEIVKKIWFLQRFNTQFSDLMFRSWNCEVAYFEHYNDIRTLHCSIKCTSFRFSLFYSTTFCFLSLKIIKSSVSKGVGVKGWGGKRERGEKRGDGKILHKKGGLA